MYQMEVKIGRIQGTFVKTQTHFNCINSIQQIHVDTEKNYHRIMKTTVLDSGASLHVCASLWQTYHSQCQTGDT